MDRSKARTVRTAFDSAAPPKGSTEFQCRSASTVRLVFRRLRPGESKPIPSIRSGICREIPMARLAKPKGEFQFNFQPRYNSCCSRMLVDRLLVRREFRGSLGPDYTTQNQDQPQANDEFDASMGTVP